jgi:hypothetical protein
MKKIIYENSKKLNISLKIIQWELLAHPSLFRKIVTQPISAARVRVGLDFLSITNSLSGERESK